MASYTNASVFAVQYQNEIRDLANKLECPASWIVAVIGFETGFTFDPAIYNQAGSGAVGLIQFMPSTAKDLGTTTAALAAMTVPEQLYYVEKYFTKYKAMRKPYDSPQDLYLAVLYPAYRKKSDSKVFANNGTNRYSQNKVFDLNNNGVITIGEIRTHFANKFAKVAAYCTLPNTLPPTDEPQQTPYDPPILVDTSAEDCADYDGVATATNGGGDVYIDVLGNDADNTENVVTYIQPEEKPYTNDIETEVLQAGGTLPESRNATTTDVQLARIKTKTGAVLPSVFIGILVIVLIVFIYNTFSR